MNIKSTTTLAAVVCGTIHIAPACAAPRDVKPITEPRCARIGSLEFPWVVRSVNRSLGSFQIILATRDVRSNGRLDVQAELLPEPVGGGGGDPVRNFVRGAASAPGRRRADLDRDGLLAFNADDGLIALIDRDQSVFMECANHLTEVGTCFAVMPKSFSNWSAHVSLGNNKSIRDWNSIFTSMINALKPVLNKCQ